MNITVIPYYFQKLHIICFALTLYSTPVQFICFIYPHTFHIYTQVFIMTQIP